MATSSEMNWQLDRLIDHSSSAVIILDAVVLSLPLITFSAVCLGMESARSRSGPSIGQLGRADGLRLDLYKRTLSGAQDHTHALNHGAGGKVSMVVGEMTVW